MGIVSLTLSCLVMKKKKIRFVAEVDTFLMGIVVVNFNAKKILIKKHKDKIIHLG